MVKELIKGLKWVGVAVGVIGVIVGLWVGCAWSLGWSLNHFFHMGSPENYISVGSFILVFTSIVLLLAIILIGWVLLAYGKTYGLVGFKKKGQE